MFEDVDFYRALALQNGMSFATANELRGQLDKSFFERFPRAFLEHAHIVPICETDRALLFATCEVSAEASNLSLGSAGKPTVLQLVTPTDLRRLWATLDLGLARGSSGGEEPGKHRDVVDLLDREGDSIEAESVALFDALALDAIGERASDLHLERYRDRVVIRLRITALEAIRASQTGHLVLSTLHSDDSVDAIQRLFDLDMHANSISGELLAVIAQRLAKRICRHCRVEDSPEQTLLDEVFPDGLESGFRLFKGAGCKHCQGRGTRGRIAVVELLRTPPAVRAMISRRPPVDQLRAVALEAGLISLRDTALWHVKEGNIALQELPRILPAEKLAAPDPRAILEQVGLGDDRSLAREPRPSRREGHRGVLALEPKDD